MTLIDGGMRGTANPNFAGLVQEARWPSRIDRASAGNETHYFDFYVEVPDLGDDDPTYFGYVSYRDYQLRIFGNRYETWMRNGTDPIATLSATTAGRHNIGIRVGDGQGIWVDGTQLTGWTPGLGTGGPAMTTRPEVGFGSMAVEVGEDEYTPGLIIFDNLNYFKAWNRTELEEEDSVPSGGIPRVTTKKEDGPQPVTVDEVCDLTHGEGEPEVVESPWKTTEGSCMCVRVDNASGTDNRFYLPNGRRQTGLVISDNADGLVNDGGSLAEGPGLLPGVARRVNVDAVGTPTNFSQQDPTAASKPDTRSKDEPEEDQPDGIDDFACIAGAFGGGSAAPPMASAPDAGVAPEASSTNTELSVNSLSDTEGEETCACRAYNASEPQPVASIDDVVGMWGNGNNGHVFDTTADQSTAPPEQQACGFESWNAADTYKGLSKDHQAVYDKLLKDGWKFATINDGSKTTDSLDGNDTDIDVEVKDEWWAKDLAKGNNVQWKDDRWGVDFDNKVIYIDAGWSCDDTFGVPAAQILAELAQAILDQGGDIAKTDFHKGNWQEFLGWAGLDEVTKQLLEMIADKTDAASMALKRAATQLGSLALAGLQAVGDILRAEYSEIGAIVAAGAAAAAVIGVMFRAIRIARSIKITASGIAHVLERHVAGGTKTAGKSLFKGGEAEVRSLIKAARSTKSTAQTNGRLQRIVDAGKEVGVDRATGKATSKYTVITEANGDLVTAFPGTP